MYPHRLVRLIAPAVMIVVLGCARSGEAPDAEAAEAGDTTTSAQGAIDAAPLHTHVRCPNHGRQVLPHPPQQTGGTIKGAYVRISYPANAFPGNAVVNVLPEPDLHGFRLSRAPQQDVEVWLVSGDSACQDPGPPYGMDVSGQMISAQTRVANDTTWAVATVPASAFRTAGDSAGVGVVTGFVILSN